MRLSFSSLFSRVALLTAILSFSAQGIASADSTYTLGWGTASGSEGTYTNFTATSGSVTGIVSFSAAKNESTSNPAYNSSNSELRLYYHTGGNGGSITLTPASGITITGFVMTTSTTPSVKYSVDGGSATSVTASKNTYTVSGISATSSIIIQNVNTSNTQLRIKTIQISYTGGGTPTCETPTFSIEEGTYYGTQSVELACATDGATIHFTTNGATPTSSSPTYSSAISVSSTTTIKAIAVKSEYEDSEVASATYTIKDPIEGYDIDFEEAPEAYVDWVMDNIANSHSGITAHGGSKYGSNLNSSGNGVTTASIQTKNKIEYPNVFTCFVSKTSGNTTASSWKIQVSSDGSSWTDINTLSAIGMDSGDWVEFTGNIKEGKYTNVYVRLYYGSSSAIRAVDDISLTTYIPVAVEEPVITVPSTFTISTTASISCETDGATIYYSYDNSSWEKYTSELTITSTTTIYAKAIKGLDESTVAQVTTTKELAIANVTISDDSFDIGETATVSTDGPAFTLTSSNPSIASVDGVTVTGVTPGSATITATWSANEDYAAGSKNFSVTITGPALSYATLPFSFNSGKSGIAEKDGLSHSGLGSDYSTVDNTKLKFDSTDDNLILKINEKPGVLSFSIKGNGFSGGTFKVQVSSDGVSYSDAAVYTTLGDEEEKTIDDLASNVRYIKWIYTTKSSGNVGLGNINLTKPTVNPETIDITASLNNGFYWATFYNGESRYTLPEGAQAFTLNASKQLYILGTDGSVIPAGTAVIIKADSASITLTKSNDASSISVNGVANILVGSDAPTPTYSVVGTPYVLGVSGGTLGYYKYTGSGIPAGKAYYTVNE